MRGRGIYVQASFIRVLPNNTNPLNHVKYRVYLSPMLYYTSYIKGTIFVVHNEIVPACLRCAVQYTHILLTDVTDKMAKQMSFQSLRNIIGPRQTVHYSGHYYQFAHLYSRGCGIRFDFDVFIPLNNSSCIIIIIIIIISLSAILRIL